MKFSKKANYREIESILQIDDRIIRDVIRKMDTQDVAAALVTASEEIQDKFLRNMSKRAGRMILEDMGFITPLPKYRINQARENMMKKVAVAVIKYRIKEAVHYIATHLPFVDFFLAIADILVEKHQKEVFTVCKPHFGHPIRIEVSNDSYGFMDGSQIENGHLSACALILKPKVKKYRRKLILGKLNLTGKCPETIKELEPLIYDTKPPGLIEEEKHAIFAWANTKIVVNEKDGKYINNWSFAKIVWLNMHPRLHGLTWNEYVFSENPTNEVLKA